MREPITPAAALAAVQALWNEGYRPFVGADGAIALADVATIAMLVDSGAGEEIYAALGAAPGLKPFGGEIQPAELLAFELRLVNLEYDSSIVIRRTHLEDDKLGLYRTRVREMSAKGTDHPRQGVAAVLEANPLGYDKKALFAADHVVGDSGIIDNALVPEMAGDAPTVLEVETAIKAAISALKAVKDDRGDRLWTGGKFRCRFASALSWAFTALAANERIGEAGAEKTNEVRGHFDPEEDPFLTSDVRFYTYLGDRPTKPIVVQERTALQTGLLGPGSDEWEKRKRAVFTAYARRAFGPGRFDLINRSTFTKS